MDDDFDDLEDLDEEDLGEDWEDDEGPDEFGLTWPTVTSEEFFDTMEELGIEDGDDAAALFDAVFADDTEAMQEWLDSW
jgi:hypothetical protein